MGSRIEIEDVLFNRRLSGDEYRSLGKNFKFLYSRWLRKHNIDIKDHRKIDQRREKILNMAKTIARTNKSKRAIYLKPVELLAARLKHVGINMNEIADVLAQELRAEENNGTVKLNICKFVKEVFDQDEGIKREQLESDDSRPSEGDSSVEIRKQAAGRALTFVQGGQAKTVGD